MRVQSGIFGRSLSCAPGPFFNPLSGRRDQFCTDYPLLNWHIIGALPNRGRAMSGHQIAMPPIEDKLLLWTLVAAVEEACRCAQIKSPSDPLAEIVAMKVIEAAKQGERDPVRLRDLAVRALRSA